MQNWVQSIGAPRCFFKFFSKKKTKNLSPTAFAGCGAELGRSAWALKSKARKCREVSFSELFDRCMSPSQRVEHVSNSVARLLNRRGSMHGVVMHDNPFGVHLNSRGAKEFM